MTPAEFKRSIRSYCRRRPFRPFIIEFSSGSQIIAKHPEAVGTAEGLWYVRATDG